MPIKQTAAQKTISDRKKAARAEKARIRAAEYYAQNTDEVLEKQRQKYEDDGGRKKQRYYEKNKRHILAQQLTYKKKIASTRKREHKSTRKAGKEARLDYYDEYDEYDPLPNFLEFILD